LLDIEKAQLPESQYLVQNYRIAQDLRKKLQDEFEEKQRLYRRLAEIDRSKWNTRNRIQRIVGSRFQNNGLGVEGGTFERRAFVRACSVEGCRGFLSSALKCGTCDTYACGECFGIVGKERHGEHTCDPNDIETAKFIKKESRPCPTCAINISKIDGCDQMFCVQCRTAFSWRTGVIVTGTIHNPHYFQMLRDAANGEIPRQPGDDGGCPQEVNNPGGMTISIYEKLRSRGFSRGQVYTDITSSHRHVCHLFGDTMHTLRYQETDTLDLRLQYLLGNFDEVMFKRKLVLREKATQKHAALLACYGARVQMTIDIMRGYLADEFDEKHVIERLTGIHEMMTGFLHGIGKRFNCLVEIGYCPRSVVVVEQESAKKQRVE
jgi:hypothetical protein